mgnify:CR=1 FL=1
MSKQDNNFFIFIKIKENFVIKTSHGDGNIPSKGGVNKLTRIKRSLGINEKKGVTFEQHYFSHELVI